MDRPDDWDVFQFAGRAGETIVAEVYARRLDSPLDSVLKLTDAAGKLLAFNDDHEDLGSGVNTHHADSYLMAKLPADGTYYVHLGDTARNGGEEYRLPPAHQRAAAGFRAARRALQHQPPQQDPPRTVSVYAIRKDGFTGPIKLSLKDPPPGFSAASGLALRHAGRGAADGQDRPGRDDRAGQPVDRGQREDRRAGDLARGRAGGRPDAGLPVAASRSRQGAEGPGLQPLRSAPAQTRPAAPARLPRPRPMPRPPPAAPRPASPSSPSNRLPGACGSSSSSSKRGCSQMISTTRRSRNAKRRAEARRRRSPSAGECS